MCALRGAGKGKIWWCSEKKKEFSCPYRFSYEIPLTRIARKVRWRRKSFTIGGAIESIDSDDEGVIFQLVPDKQKVHWFSHSIFVPMLHCIDPKTKTCFLFSLLWLCRLFPCSGVAHHATATTKPERRIFPSSTCVSSWRSRNEGEKSPTIPDECTFYPSLV